MQRNPTLRIASCLLALVCAAMSSNQRETSPAGKMKVILDTDIGSDIDDAWALAFVISRDEFQPLGITITDGDTPARARIACKMLHLAGRDDMPVAVGRRTPVPADRSDHQFSWAEDFTAKTPIAQPAADFIVEQVMRYPDDVTLIAVGPLQNVADALRKEPKLAQHLKRVVLMSGCIYESAWKAHPVAEWNVVSSTADAQLVYGAGLPLTIVPLDSTTRVVLQEEERQRVRKHRSPLTTALESLYRLWLDSPAARMTLHDQLAVAEAARPGSFFGKKPTLPIRVDDRGFTQVDAGRGKPVVVCLEPKRNEFLEFYISILTAQRLGM